MKKVIAVKNQENNLQDESEWILEVVRGITIWIEENLEKRMEIRDVTIISGYSHWYFQRIFKEVSGTSLAQYIRNRKLLNALYEIIMTDVKIIDVGMKYGFSSHGAFTRTFINNFHIKPSQVRKIIARNINSYRSIARPFYPNGKWFVKNVMRPGTY